LALVAGGAGSDGAPPLTELNPPLLVLRALLAAPTGAMGAGTGAAGVGTAGDTEPAPVGCEGITGAAAASVPPKAGGAGTALASIGTLSAATGACADGESTLGSVLVWTLLAPTTAPGGGTTLALEVPLDTELNPCACVATDGVANAVASARADRKRCNRTGNAVIARRFYSSSGAFAVSSLTSPVFYASTRVTNLCVVAAKAGCASFVSSRHCQ
jgi:hypothetical protein